MNRANYCWLGLFLWINLVAYILPKLTDGQIFWFLLATLIAGIYTIIITVQTYDSGGRS